MPEYEVSDDEKEKITQSLEEYNATHADDEKISFMHGTGSAVLEFVGKKVKVARTDDSVEEKTIPDALIPTGKLRKEFGVYPISGELGVGTFGMKGRRKEGLNYSAISGMTPNELGVDTVMTYATGGAQVRNANDIQQIIKGMITKLDQGNYVRYLKMLTMEATILMQMDPNAKSSIDDYIRLLRNEQQALMKANPGNQNIKKYFDKYIARIDRISNGHDIPFTADQVFKDGIQNQYPIVLCSTAQSKAAGLGMQGERIIEGNLPLASVKLIYTDEQHVDDLKDKLQNAGLTHIDVKGFTLTELAPVEESESVKSFKSAATTEELKEIVQQESSILDEEKAVQHKLMAALEKYFETGDVTHLNMASYLITESPRSSLSEDLLGRYSFMSDVLTPKVKASSDYLQNAAPLLTEQHYDRLMQIMKLDSVLLIRSRGLDDYAPDNPLTKSDIDSVTHNGEDKKCLVTLYEMFSKALANNPHNQEIATRLTLVKSVAAEYGVQLETIKSTHEDEKSSTATLYTMMIGNKEAAAQHLTEQRETLQSSTNVTETTTNDDTKTVEVRVDHDPPQVETSKSPRI